MCQTFITFIHTYSERDPLMHESDETTTGEGLAHSSKFGV